MFAVFRPIQESGTPGPERVLLPAGETDTRPCWRTLYLEDDVGKVARVIAGAGSVVAIPGGREHTIRNESQAEALAYVVFAPGSEIERLVHAADELAAHGTAEPADVLALAERHGMAYSSATE